MTLATDQFETRLAKARYSVFRLETLQEYRGSGEDEWLAAFEAGASAPPPDPAQDAWETLLHAHRDAGRVWQRVHVVREPLSRYMEFELAWAYPPNAVAGEDIRIIPVAGDEWPVDVPDQDYWLIDSWELYEARYGPDGTWLGIERVDDPRWILAACRARDAALHHGRSLWKFLDAHPAVAERVAPAYVPIPWL